MYLFNLFSLVEGIYKTNRQCAEVLLCICMFIRFINGQFGLLPISNPWSTPCVVTWAYELFQYAGRTKLDERCILESLGSEAGRGHVVQGAIAEKSMVGDTQNSSCRAGSEKWLLAHRGLSIHSLTSSKLRHLRSARGAVNFGRLLYSLVSLTIGTHLVWVGMYVFLQSVEWSELIHFMLKSLLDDGIVSHSFSAFNFSRCFCIRINFLFFAYFLSR